MVIICMETKLINYMYANYLFVFSQKSFFQKILSKYNFCLLVLAAYYCLPRVI